MLKNPLRKEPPTIDPKWYTSNLLTIAIADISYYVYHWIAIPDITKLSILINIYMHL